MRGKRIKKKKVIIIIYKQLTMNIMLSISAWLAHSPSKRGLSPGRKTKTNGNSPFPLLLVQTKELLSKSNKGSYRTVGGSNVRDAEGLGFQTPKDEIKYVTFLFLRKCQALKFIWNKKEMYTVVIIGESGDEWGKVVHRKKQTKNGAMKQGGLTGGNRRTSSR